MMSLTFGLFTQVSGSGPLGPLVIHLVENGTYEYVVCLSIHLSVRWALYFCFWITPHTVYIQQK